jgi:DNA gyrase subunit A
MHNYLLIFTDSGRMFWIKVYELPEGAKNAKGRPIQNLLQIPKEDKIRSVINVKTLSDQDYINNNYLVFCTQNGTIKKTTLEAFSRPRQAGIIAISINEGDRLLDVRLTSGTDQVIIAKKSGKAVRFPEEQVRPMGRNAAGVKAITLESEDDQVIGMVCVPTETEQKLLVVSEKGYGKMSVIDDYRLTNRGAKGVITLNITEKTGKLVAILDVTEKDELMIINKSGILIRMKTETLRVMGRNTQGVRLIKLSETDEIMSIAKIESEEEVEQIEGSETMEGAENTTNEAPNGETNNGENTELTSEA